MTLSKFSMRMAFVSMSLLCTFAAPMQEIHATSEPKVKVDSKSRVPVGMVGKISRIVIPGGEIEALPDDDPLAKIVVRVAETYRHGDGFRYDLEFTGFEPGTYDLARSLKPKDPNAPPGPMPLIDVEITSALAPGRIEPARPAAPEIRSWWKYWTMLNIFIGCWIAGLAGLFTWSNRVNRATKRAIAEAEAPPPTVAQRLRPLVSAACEGTLEPHARADLESLLIAYWTDRLHFDEGVAPGHILSKLKSDPEAGPLVSKFEEWLHMPPGSGQATADEITELLKPYENVPETSLVRPGTGQGAN